MSDVGRIRMPIMLIIPMFMLSLKSINSMFNRRIESIMYFSAKKMISYVGRLCERNMKENEKSKQYGDLRMKLSGIKFMKCLKGICMLSLRRTEGRLELVFSENTL